MLFSAVLAKKNKCQYKKQIIKSKQNKKKPTKINSFLVFFEMKENEINLYNEMFVTHRLLSSVWIIFGIIFSMIKKKTNNTSQFYNLQNETERRKKKRTSWKDIELKGILIIGSRTTSLRQYYIERGKRTQKKKKQFILGS